MLLLSGTSERRTRQQPRIRALAEAADFTRLAALLTRHQLFPLLAVRLQAILPEKVPPDFREELARAVDEASRRGALLEALALQFQDDLERRGIRALPLKGPLLSRSLYADPGLRPAIDLDILVPGEQLAEAVEVVREHGYGPPNDLMTQDGYPTLHYRLRHKGGLPPVEIHWRVHWYETKFAREMLDRSIGTPNGRRPQPEDELASLLLFYSRDGFLGLRQPVDIATWWDRHRRDLETPVVDRIAQRNSKLRRALSASACALDDLVGVPAAQVISTGGGLGWRFRAAVRLRNWDATGSRDQTIANISLVDWLLTPPRGGRDFVRRSLIPPREKIRDMYGLGSGARWRTHFWRVAHGPKLLARYAIALWGVRRGRHWAPLPPTSPTGSEPGA
jgi:hypothetical protein